MSGALSLNGVSPPYLIRSQVTHRLARLVPVRSRREPLRTWESLTAVGLFAEAVGIKGFSVEL